MPSIKRLKSYATVVLDDAVDKPLDYSNTDENLQIGSRVLVPLRKSLRKGTVVSIKSKSLIEKVLPIHEVLSEKSFIPSDLFSLATFMANYYSAPLRRVLKFLLPPSIRNETRPKMQLFIKRVLSQKQTVDCCTKLREKHPTQAKILDVILKKPKGILLSELLEQAKVSKSPVDTLVKKKILRCEKIQDLLCDEHEFFQTKPKKLNEEQQIAFNRISANLNDHQFQTHLIHGVTGSGKTEVYLQAIQKARDLKRGVIMLVPEIALTTQTIERLRSRFTEKMGILHHRLSDGERYKVWNQIRDNEIQIVIGARSALFSPVQNLGLIIIDEEHDSSYKQSDDAPCYHARDLAVMRGKFSNATVVLGSATPSVESYYNAKSGKYLLSTLSARAEKTTLPCVTIVDMKREYDKAGGFTSFSDTLLTGIKKRIELGEQVLLFLNRRGYHSFQMCVSCNSVVKCPRCDVSLTYHKRENKLTCHLCGHLVSPPPTTCPSCKSIACFKFKGVGTELVERSLHQIFPEIRTLRMDADTTRHKGSHDRLFKQFRSGKADVLIGTQMIAKGLHFPSVTLVGILNSDLTLNIPDFRSSENLFQLITQVAGRSGRAALRGEVVLQTSLINHPIMKYASVENFTGFYEEEIAAREHFEYPPFSHLAKLTFSGKEEEKVKTFAQRFHQLLQKKLSSNYLLYPVIPSGHAKIKDRYRYKFLVKGKKVFDLVNLLSQMRRYYPPPKSIRLLIDIDPLSTFF